MTIAKITLKLGKKKIELTEEEFEELKQDMRELDSSYRYYWYNGQHHNWQYPSVTYTSTEPFEFTSGTITYSAQ